MKQKNPAQAIREATAHFRAEVDAIRERISRLRAEREETLHGPLPKAEAIEKMEAAVNRLAAGHEERYAVSECVFGGRDPVGGVRTFFEAMGNVDPHAGKRVKTDMAPLLATLFGEQVKRHLRQRIEAAGHPEGPPAKDRNALAEGMDKQIRGAEIEEETMILQAEEAGIEILRREDCNPAIVLGLPEQPSGLDSIPFGYSPLEGP